MPAAFAPSNDIEICYETFGHPDDSPLLLVMGFSAQMIAWDEAFCQGLAERGRFVIRFDNRDCGLSSKLDGIEVDLVAIMTAVALGQVATVPAPYTLSTFSDDAFGLLDHLGIDQAHIVGASMGGMIVQTMAVERPERVLSMTSIMSTTGEADYFKSDPEVMAALLTPAPTERQAFIEFNANRGPLFSSPRYFDRARSEALAAAVFDRSFYPEGAARQLAAIQASADRSEALRSLTVPTLVLHGAADRLILPIGGERTAELIPGANHLVLKDMAHDLPQPLWPLVIDAIISHSTHRVG